jgi:hypothetical protein
MRSNAGHTGNREARLLQAAAGRAASRAGFTLMEIVVAVGAVALVAVGLASIFDTVGKTVTGGKRVSNLNTYAGLLEKQLRTDFEAMNRDGFLVIRNQWVDNSQNGAGDGIFGEPASNSPVGTADTVPVSPDAVTARARRIDEILFFVNGHFTSARQPLWPNVQATSSVAEVYYGHGQRSVPLAVPPGDPIHPTYKKPFPRIDGRNAVPSARLGLPPGAGQPADANPNYYAGNWTLLRHLTLLSKPGTADNSPVPLGDRPFGLNPTSAAQHPLFADSYTQVSMQPAVSSIFRTIQSNFFPNNAQTLRRISDGGTFYPPFLGSGMVDIATTDLAEVRATVMGGASIAGPNPIMYPYQVTGQDLPLIATRAFFPVMENRNDQYRNARPVPNNYNDLDRIQSWMSDAFPTDSRNQQARQLANDFPADALDTSNMGTRMRYEPESADLLSTISFKRDGTPVPASLQTLPVNEQIAAFSDRADQLMLSRTGMVPHCSEFIVEWSFGSTDPNGQVIWHGLNRRADTNGDGVIDTNDGLVAYPSPWGPNDQYAEFSYQTGNIVNDNTGVGTALLPAGATNPGGGHHVTDRLIYGFSPTGTEACLTSYFGWTDPTFDPSVASGSHYDQSGTLPWPWPRLIRVTVTLSDPQEPAIESTFQYIFNTPDAKPR